MWGDRYFGRYWGNRYWSNGGEGDPPEPAAPSTTRNLVIGLGSMPKQKNHPHPLFSKITG
jgi:hypothetical protein